MTRAIITGTGSYIPETVVPNNAFAHSEFFEKGGAKLYTHNNTTIDKFAAITGIKERRYARTDQQTSDLAYLSAVEAIKAAGIDKELLDYIIVAHNFGDISHESNRTSQVPSIASRVKSMLQIQNPDCVAYDLAFGCPGWVEGMIQANYFIRSGDAKRCLVIGAETLSRVIDPHDRDSMLFSDGGGAAIVEAYNGEDRGIIAHKTRTYATDHLSMLSMDCSCSPYTQSRDDRYLKMEGRRVYEFALTNVPALIKDVLDSINTSIDDVRKILIHQANTKMDEAILSRLLQLYNRTTIPEGIMPMTIHRLGNSSVATIPTLLDLLVKGQLEEHAIKSGDLLVFASIGAGMNINAIVYRV